MLRRVVVTLTFAALGLVVSASAAGAAQTESSVQVPHSVGIMGAVEAPPSESGSPAAPVLQIAGIVLVLGGGLVVARSWVSPAKAV